MRSAKPDKSIESIGFDICVLSALKVLEQDTGRVRGDDRCVWGWTANCRLGLFVMRDRRPDANLFISYVMDSSERLTGDWQWRKRSAKNAWEGE